MASSEQIRYSAEKVIALIKQGHQVVVVVSAMSGETDRLIRLAQSMSILPSPREQAALISTGEQVAAALMAIYLQERGHPALSLSASQIPIRTTPDYLNARISDIDTTAVLAALKEGKTPVIAGFQGIDQAGYVTTLGRGGSDTTAVAIAAVLQAEECQIFTDVDGVYTCDPRLVPEARRLARVTVDEMLELASLGAKVLQKRSVELAGKYRVNLRVLSSMVEGPGTLITFEENEMETPLVSGLACHRNEAKLSVRGVPDSLGVTVALIEPLSLANIDIDMLVQHTSMQGTVDLTFTVSRDHYLKAFELLEIASHSLEAKEISGDQNIAKISLVGVGMRSHPEIPTKMFKILAKENIAIQLIASGEIKVSVIIDEKYLELAARSLHAGFGLGEGE